ncbi:MAG: lytic transglycosylase domain-containing protein [Oscillospiraceae bacterium]|nr:lytic transglycosylase domain-containing protein [Oscillospiraceae bacterium]
MRKKKRNIGKFLLLVIGFVTLISIGMFVYQTRYYPLRYFDTIQECAVEYGLEPELICAVINTESRFNKDAVSRRGASGLMQIIDSTAYWLAPKMGIDDFDYDQIFEPALNIQMGCYYLSMLERQYGDLNVALSAYNAGSGNVDQWLQDSEYSDDGQTLKHIPFQETQDYIERITKNQKIYLYVIKVYNLFK